MFIEKRGSGKNIKFYLVHSYRGPAGKVQKIRRFLGTNLSPKELQKLQQRAQELILEQVRATHTSVFEFDISPKERDSLNKYNDQMEIIHFDEQQWLQFTQEFVYNTNAIEGSDVLLDEVPAILDKKETADVDEIETKGVAKAVQFIRTTKQDLTLGLLRKLHKLCFAGSKDFAGEFRTVEVVIRARDGTIIHQGTPVSELQDELQEFISWYKKNKRAFKPLVLAAIVHNQFENIHPFQDGNGRVGRLLLNFILLQHNYPPINILLEDRNEYYMTLYEYSHNDKLRPTLQFLIKQYKKTLKKVKAIKRH